MNSIIERAHRTFANKRVLIFGLGTLGGGIGDARFFAGLGAQVIVTDLKTETELAHSIQQLADYNISFHLGGHQEDDIWQADYILKNPSVPNDHPLIQLARKINKPVIMRSSLFAELSQIPIIGITGTRGKTTTTSMIFEILTKTTDRQVLLGGNIKGISDLELLSRIDDTKQPIAVMELSSWQLQGFAALNLSPHIAVITNLFPDHLNRYPSLEAYYHDKRQIVAHQTSGDYAVLNHQQPEFHQWAQTINSQVVWFDDSHIPPTLHLKLRGRHNYANAAAALSVANIVHIDPKAATAVLNQFAGVDYRLQTIAISNGIEWINDTTATTPVATMAALQSATKPPIVIVGGADKQLPLEDLAKALNQSTKKIILLQGSGTDKLLPLLKASLVLGPFDSMQTAVSSAKSVAHPGDVVILSPAFASFGLFVNEFDRGDQFNQCVRHLD